MAPSYKVRKSTTEKRKKGRGRPKLYNESWRKKLILLRICGLDLNHIISILDIQSNGAVKTKLRTAQHHVHELLAGNDARFCPPDDATARKCAAFLRAALHHDGESPQTQKSRNLRKRPKQAAKMVTDAPSDSLFSQNFKDSLEQYVSSSEDSSIGDLADVLSIEEIVPFKSSSSVTKLLMSSLNSRGAAVSRRHEAKLPVIDEEADSVDEEYVTTHSIQHEPQQRSMAREIMSEASFSSSQISDILSLVEKRSSRGTSATWSRYSLSVASMAYSDIIHPDMVAAKVLEELQYRTEKANDVIQEYCCSRNNECRHQFTAEHTMLDRVVLPDLETRVRLARSRDSPSAEILQQPLDLYANNQLHYAAQFGVSPDVLKSILDITPDVNAVNCDGQTFMFFLNLQHFHKDTYKIWQSCTCIPDPHSTFRIFECFLRSLERLAFDFDRLDHNGRPFLFFLCSSPHFDTSWLLDLMASDSQWEYRVWRAAQTRDATGLFLIDFLALHPSFESMTEDVRAHFRPGFFPHTSRPGEARLLRDEDHEGKTQLHNYLQRDFLYTAPDHELPIPIDGIASDINKYSAQGRTPIMDFLQQAFDRCIPEVVICAKVEQLIKCGANVNARSRGGSIILHFAAKKALPLLLKTLLAFSIQVDHRDNDGLNALDYVAKVVQRSQNAKAPAEVTARSLRSASTLLGSMAFALGRRRSPNARAIPKKMSDYDIFEEEVAEQAARTMSNLLASKITTGQRPLYPSD